MVALTNTSSGVSAGDQFIAISVNDCGQWDIAKITSELNPCPTGVSFYRTWISGNVPYGCYEGTETVTLSDSHLLPQNIKLGTTILGVTGTYDGPSYINAGNFTLGQGLLTGPIPEGLYDGAEVANIIDSDHVAGNITSGINIFGVTGTYTGETIPAAFADNGYHVGDTFGPYIAAGFNTYTTAHQTAAISDGTNLYLCYSGYVGGGYLGTGWNYGCVYRYDGTTLSLVFRKNSPGSDYYGRRYKFTYSVNAGKIYFVYGYEGSGLYYFMDEIELSTGSVTTGLFAYSVPGDLPTTAVLGTLTYEPKLATTLHTDGINTGYTALSCNVDIYA